MTNEPRRHHYVSQFYLQQFSESNEQIHVIDVIDRRYFVTGSSAIAVQTDFNRINIEGHNRNEIERFLSGIEGQAATVLKDIAQNESLPQNDDDMAILSVFVGILAVNNPQVREKLRNIDETIAGQRMQEMVATREAYESCLSEWGLEDPIGYEVMRAFVKSGNYTISYEDSNGYYLAQVFFALDLVVFPMLDKMRWSLLIAEDNSGDFITSDRPVILFRNITDVPDTLPRYITTPSGLILPNKTPTPGLHINLDLTMSLNPRMAFYATEPDNPMPIEHADRNTVAIINKRIIDASAKQIYCSNLDFEYLDNEQIQCGRDLIDE